MFTYEISLCMRDALGNVVTDPEGRIRKKTFVSDKADDVADFWNRNSYKRKKKEKGQSNAQSSKEAP